MEDFVTFEIAKKLKEKGFREECFAHYPICGEDYEEYNCIEDDRCGISLFDLCRCYNNEDSRLIDAPTISQVLKWLREEKEIDIILQPIFLYNENNREREYGIEIYAPQLNKSTHLDYFKKWEKGAVAGIDYVLDNLI